MNAATKKSNEPVEPQWEMGKHDWRNDTCMICGLCRLYEVRDKNTGTHRVVRHMLFGDEVEVAHVLYESPSEGELERFAPPCAPRLAQAIDGLLTMKQAADMLHITIHVFKNRQRTRRIRPTAVLKTANVYLYRLSDVRVIGMDEKEWKQWEDAGWQMHRTMTLPWNLPTFIEEHGVKAASTVLQVSVHTLEVLIGGQTRHGFGFGVES